MAKGDELNKKAYDDALKSAEKLTKEYEKGLDNVKQTQEAFSKVSTQLFGIAGAAFFKEVPKTVKELEKGKNAATALKNELSDSFAGIAKDVEGQFGKVFDYLKKGPEPFKFEPDLTVFKEIKGNFKDMASLEKEINKKFKDRPEELKKFEELKKEYNNDHKKYLQETDEFYIKAIKRDPKFLDNLTQQEKIDVLRTAHQEKFSTSSERGQEAFRKMATYTSSVDENTKKAAYEAGILKDTMPEILKDLEGASKKAFSLSEGFKDIGKNLAADIIPNMMEYDKVISDAGKNFGFIDTKSISTSQTMASLGSEAARFNVSMEDSVGMMGKLGDELKTIDQNYLANSVKQFMAIEKAIGLSYDETGDLAGEMMRTGKSAEEVKDFVEKSNNLSKNFGVNIKKVMQGVSKNLSKMRQMGFQGGEESLTRMAIKAERLNMQVDEIFDVAKKARTIEGAMDMAAELQLAGGSFANLDPMSLISAARKSPEELQKILTQMGGDIGTFNKETGELKFDAVDIDRLQIVADATGQSLDSMQKGLMKSASDANKIKMFGNITDGLEEMDAAMVNSGVADMMKIGKNGELELNASSDIAKRLGIDSLEELQGLTGEQLKQKMEADKVTLEKQAEANKSLDDSLKSFKQALLNIFIQFEPVLNMLTKAMNFLVEGFNILPGWGKMLVGGLVGAFMLFGSSVGMFITQGIGGFLKGSLDFGKSIISFGKSSFDFLKNIGSSDTWKGAKDSMVDKLKNSFTPKGGKDPVSDALKKGGDIASDKSMTTKDGAEKAGFLEGLSKGIASFNQVKLTDLLIFAASLLIIGGAIVGFTYALASVGGEASMSQWINAGAALVLLGGSVFLMSKIFGNVDMGNIAKGALAMVLVGASLIPFAFAMNMLGDFDAMGALKAIGILTLVMVGLAALGYFIEVIGIPLAIGAAVLLGVSLVLMAASVRLSMLGEAFEKLSTINWDGFSGMGSALLSTVPGLLAFSLASMMFLNPIALLGMIAMTATLGGLALVMIPLGIGMTMAADGMARFADGLEKLQAAANNLDFERLEALKDLSIGMASSGAGGGLSDSVDKIVEALATLNGKGGSGSGGARKLEVDLKINGRFLKQLIIEDCEIVS